MLVLVLSTTYFEGIAQIKNLSSNLIVNQTVDEAGNPMTCVRVPGVPAPKVKMPDAVPTATSKILTNVPAFNWSFGCSATAAAMMAGYYDRTGYYNMYAGPTQSGLMPMDNSSWPDVTINGEVRHQCPLSATRNGVDGRLIKGHVDDYWVSYNSASPDPYIGNWTEHSWGQCTGDYMGTNQSTKGNADGSTLFWFYNSGAPMCNKYSATQWDGAYGLAKFFESRGYTVLSNCTQLIYSASATSGCTFADFKAQIDAGRPALLQLDGHTVLGYGYDDPSTVYIHDTWDYSSHTMVWGTSYSGLAHWGMTTFSLAAVTPDPCSDIISLSGGGSVNAKTYVGGGEGVWYTSSNTPCGYVASAIEQIYSFVPPVSGYYSIEVTSASSWVEYMWKSGTCSSSGWNCISDVYSPGTYGSMYMAAGTTYYIYLDGEDATEDNHDFYIFYNPCLNVTSIAGTGAGNSHTYNGGGNGAWNTSTTNTCGYICPGREHVYSFVAPASGLYNVVVTSVNGGYVDYLYKSASCSSSGWTCIDDISSVGTYGSILLTEGTTYYFLLDDENTIVTTQTFYLNLAEPAGNWLGMVSHDWYNPSNWSAGFVPIASTDVTVNSGYTYYPTVTGGTANCDNLTTGAGTILKVNTGSLNIGSNLDIFGQLAMDNASGVLSVAGDIYWESGSSANVTAASVMWISGFWEFRYGCNVQLTNGFVDFTGSTDTYIRTYAPNCSFNNVGIYKSAGNFLGLSALSNYDLTINGYLGIQPNATLSGASTHSLILKGAFYNNNHFAFNSGTLVFDGGVQSIKPNVGDYVNNLTISSSGAVTFDNTYTSTLTINGDVLIESGSLNPANNTLQVAGNWTNTVGTAGFTEGTGKVTFNGAGHQYVLSNETFYTLEANMGAALRVNNAAYTVTCANYDWTSGGIDVLAGTFTANNLVDNGLYGSYYVNPGGTINLYNNDGWVDLNGYIYIYGGNMNVYGGSGSNSYWPFVANGGITMTDGVLDFKNVGVQVYNTASYTFLEAISGGTIRTSSDFMVQRADFTPAGGTLEFYGSNNGNFHTLNGGYVRNVLINKGAADQSNTGVSVVRDRFTGIQTDVPSLNTININNPADINGNMTIQSGVLTANSNTVNVEGNWDNQVGTTGFVEGTSTVVFDGTPYSDILMGETFYNLTENKTNSDFDALELMDNMTVNVLNNLTITDGSFELNSGTTLDVDKDITIANGAGLNANDGYLIQILLAGNWLNSNSSYDWYHGFDPGGNSTVTFNGASDQFLTTSCTREDFNNLTINKVSGEFRPNDNTQSNGSISINSGSWEDNVTGLNHGVYGDFFVGAAGSFLTAYYNNTVEFNGATQNSVLTYNGAIGYFRNILVSKTAGYSVTQATSVSTQFGGNLTINGGTFNQNGMYTFMAGNIDVNTNGTLYIPSSSLLVLTDTKALNVNSGGTLDIAGTLANPVTIRANSSPSRYAFNVNSGATISADYCLFKQMNASGINVKSGAFISAAHPFNGCTFQDGTSGGTMLTIDNNETRTIRNAVFPTNTWGALSNVTKTVNAGTINFVDFSGGWAGEANDNDVFNRVNWIPTLTSAPTALPATICAGGSSQLNATVTGGVAPYTYSWSPAGSLSNSTIVNPVATPGVTTPYAVQVADALGTIVTGNVTVTVNPILLPSVSIVASANPVTPGTSVNFTATPVNGGASPTYQWKVNGSNVGTRPSYFYVPNNHDQVTCVMTSNYPCPSANPVTSNVINMAVLVTDLSVTGTVNAPLALCFDASNVITVAGGGGAFLVKNGASAVLIAGVRINFLPGVTVEPGGYMHGYITTTNEYCGSLPPSMVTSSQGDNPAPVEPVLASRIFSIYPNPTRGEFQVRYSGTEIKNTIRVEVFTSTGNQVISTRYNGDRNHQIKLPPFVPGLYFVKIIADDQAETFKLIVTR